MTNISKSDIPEIKSLAEYEGHSFEVRADYGLRVDRESHNSNNLSEPAIFATHAKKDLSQFNSYAMRLYYTTNRSLNSSYVKRSVNAKIVDLPTVQKKMNDLLEPIMLDLLMDKFPTKKDWRNIHKHFEYDGIGTKYDRTVSRQIETHSNIIQIYQFSQFLSKTRAMIFEKHSKMFTRTNQRNNDNRVTHFSTTYSQKPHHSHHDVMIYTDANYFIRLERFWKHAINTLESILNKHGPIKKDMEWLVYHIVNNDIGLHVLFDNLSLECELSWLSKLNPQNKLEIIEKPFFADLAPLEWFDASRGVNKLETFVQTFNDTDMSPVLQQYKISKQFMRSRMHMMALQSALAYFRGRYRYAWGLIMNEIQRQF